ncbi:hypothetical protein HDU93_009533 [Gonapodya sp. JEL0774]|nr:hypothetical protein HDU93_009533 [Gonapodya sp. JEL0774]
MPKAIRSREKASRTLQSRKSARPVPKQLPVNVVTFEDDDDELDTEATLDTTASIAGSDFPEEDVEDAALTKDNKRRLKHLKWMEKLTLSNRMRTNQTTAKPRKKRPPQLLDLAPLKLSILDAERDHDVQDEERVRERQSLEERKRRKPLGNEKRRQVGGLFEVAEETCLVETLATALGVYLNKSVGEREIPPVKRKACYSHHLVYIGALRGAREFVVLWRSRSCLLYSLESLTQTPSLSSYVNVCLINKRISEILRHRQILALDAFRSNPLASIGEHVKNSVVKEK